MKQLFISLIGCEKTTLLYSMKNLLGQGGYHTLKLTSSPKGDDRSSKNKQVFSNSSQVRLRSFSIRQGQPTLQSMVGQNSGVNKGRYSVSNLQKMTLYNPNIDLVKDNVL